MSGSPVGPSGGWRDRLARSVDAVLAPARTVWTRLRCRQLPVWTHSDYRFPIPDIAAMGIEPRRSDLALWALLGAGNRRALAVHEADRIAYGHLALVHTPAWLEALTQPDRLATVYGLPPTQGFPVDAVLNTVRRACGGTLAAARHALAHGGPTLNLLGGFHHAFPDRGGGLCPVHDIAVAVAVLRAEGFRGRVVILDLDAHPPDGTAACLAHDDAVWIGSISGSDWGVLRRVDETVLPQGDDRATLRALDGLLRRMPGADLAFVLAGADVLAEDQMGNMAMTIDGVRRRDARVARALSDTPAVWLSAGGYSPSAWRVLAQTALVLIGPDHRPIPEGLDPVANRFAYVSRALDPRDLRGEEDDEPWFTEADLDPRLGGDGPTRMLGYYTAEGIEYALHAFGLLAQLRRLGYGHFRVVLDRTPTGDRARLFGNAAGEQHLLWEVILDKERRSGRTLLALQWMTMRHPLGAFPAGRAPLPGQDAPGLGLASEAVHLLERVVDRLGLDGLVYRPAWFHTARMAMPPFTFEDPAVQGAFEALGRDLGHLPLGELSRAIAEGRVRRDGRPWRWDPSPMLHLCAAAEVAGPPPDDNARAAVRDATRFTLGA